jgi:1,4-alpha-glucan branching enzyme
VHGKGSLWQRMPGDAWNKAANLRALLAYMWAHPGKQLLFHGRRVRAGAGVVRAALSDWYLLDDPLHGGIKNLVGDMNRAYREMPALWTRDVTPEGFSWIDANDSSGNVLSFLRHGVDADGKPTVMACIANFSGSPKPDYRVGLPFAGRWREVLNTDATNYGGSAGATTAAWTRSSTSGTGGPHSAVLQLPPAGVLWLAPEPFEGAVRRSGTCGRRGPGPGPHDGARRVGGPPPLTTRSPSHRRPRRRPRPPVGRPVGRDTDPAHGSPHHPARERRDLHRRAERAATAGSEAAGGPPATERGVGHTEAESCRPRLAPEAPHPLASEEPFSSATDAARTSAEDAPHPLAPESPSGAATDAPSTALVDAPARTPSADAGHPPEDDLESGADPEPTPTSAEEPTVSIPAGWDLPGQGASDEAHREHPGPPRPGGSARRRGDGDRRGLVQRLRRRRRTGSAHRNKTAQ